MDPGASAHHRTPARPPESKASNEIKGKIFGMDGGYEKHMAAAIELSRESVASGGGPFGTVIVRNGEIIGKGVNRVTIWNDPTAHAEIVAIRDACRNLHSHQLNDCIIYASAEPCPMCVGAIYWARPQCVYFGNNREDTAAIGFDDALIYGELAMLHADRKIPFHQIMRDEAFQVFKLWAAKKDKTRY